ncbi:WPP domain-interacting tail-anchored protein 2 isoform X1 [Jatropha curcas]|uniref:WPP domain-interacting tail-anchored protein 2 isoform X1 n=2 Tax=Jatropha curcas TaxID=180498 RepID=UPI0005FC04F3|nr:WPP domain-interacting tail-anchored protein 2 isoform X1 [Jatropha curcas]XP_020537571.1 WPP domain-interacting tail-anchored protein 2 isoform X1 [Jatropha curcas]XP_037492063.1 WPP domain-interacting tail-anchored protein 2 isoform X1 [Jatropha curcas]
MDDNPQSDKGYRHEGNSSRAEGMQDVESTMEVLTRSDLDLAYSSEKLVNLHVILMHLLAWDNDFELMTLENSSLSETSIEKALVFDLLSGILDSEVREVENFMDNIQADIVDVRHKIFSCRHPTELFKIMEEKLRESEESLKKTQVWVLEVKTLSVKLQRVYSPFMLENWKDDKSIELSANGQLPNFNANSKEQTVEQQRNILRMLEKSLASELDLEKQSSELRQNEEQLKLKLHYTEQVAFRMEEAAEVVWGRFLEAENAAEVLMGISKELVGRLQVVQFNLNGSLQREAKLKSELQGFTKQLDAKDSILKKLEGSIAEHKAKSSEVPALKEKVNSLEERLKRAELHLKSANVLNEESQDQLNEMENIVESLKESIYEAESRADTAEAKVAQLTDTNVELTEEINFLKSSGDSNTKKVSLLEKQVRELEIQLQHSKASSEASQEQQNMLYAAIWDMETLIEDLKSKVSKAESKTEGVEEQCIILSDTNMELDKELSFLRSRVKALEASLDQVNKLKAATAKEINRRTRLIMDTAMQLAREREQIQNQLIALTKENGVLVQKLRNAKGDAPIIAFQHGDDNDKKTFFSENLSTETCKRASEEAVPLSKSSEADKVFKDGSRREIETESSDSKLKLEKTEQKEEAHPIRNFKAVLVAVIAVIVIYLLHKKKPVLFDNFYNS